MAKFFIDRPVFAWVIAIMMMLGGALCIKLLAVEQYPDIAPPSVTVSAVYPGADAQTIENTVTQLIEQNLTGLDNLIYMKSTSSAQGVVQTTLTFAPGTSPDFAQVQVLNKVESIKSRLPESVQKNGVSVAKNNTNFLKVIGFYSTNPQKTQADIADFIYSTVQDPIRRVQGVGDTQLFGSEYAMRVWLDPNKLNYFNLSIEEIIAAIQAQNAQVTAGQLGALPVTEGQELNATITAQSRLKTPEQFQNILVRVNTDGSNVLLKDVANVEIGAADYNFLSRYDGKPSAGLGIYLATGANQLDTSAQVDQKIQELSQIFPEDIKFAYPYDTTPFVKLSINNVIHTLIEAIILVVIVMYVFLQNLRSTLIPTITVPVVLLGTFAVLYICGFTINTLSMFAMVLAIGLLVDDAIVVIENVERIMHDEGLSPYDATVKSMEQITSALVGIAVVLSAVFVPMAFYGGAAGGIYRQFSITIVTSMSLSVLMAIVLTPALCAQILKAPSKNKVKKTTLGEKLVTIAPFCWCSAGTKWFFDKFNNLYNKSLHLYEKGVIKFIRYPVISFICYVLIVVGLVFGFNRLPTGFLPNEDQGVLIVLVELPPGSTLDQTMGVLNKTSNFYMTQKADSVKEIFTVAGFSMVGRGQNMGLGFIRLKDWDERKRPDQKVDALVGSGWGFASTITEGRVIITNVPAVPSLGMANGFSYMLKDSAGLGHNALMGAFFQLLGQAAREPQLQQVRPGSMLDVPQYKINVDFETAQALGVAVSSVNTVLSTALGSAYIDDFVYNNRVKKVYLQSDAAYRMLPDDFSFWHVKNQKGEMVPYDAFATTTKSYGSPSLVRYDGVAAMGISGSAAPGMSSGQAMAIMEELSKQLPKGFSFDWTDISYQERQTGSQTTTLYIISLIVVFLSLAALYESWTVPISILFVIPLGIIGTVYATMFRGLDNDIYFIVGLLTTMGLSAKNAILIVEFAKDALEKEGKSLIDATLEACRLRLRPILMTSFAFILGVLPLALNSGAGSASQNAVGTGVIGGMITATFLAIFYVPLFFLFVTKLFTKHKNKVVLPSNYNGKIENN
ncbi:efflux RND transporter permease subunit [Gilliamella apicola]|uniref:efflux RND transporter permease subunit n=1 Tax=Gilliamella apicola TaxID=1196095 RepID=UPI00080E6534|nr:efflux RND transporter permease subunit [Gilliamella apicola]OCG12860.1 multidrug efflux RND transporter permease [Gilliamella apicola]ORF45162.1 hydrophobe/amphiphile efflux-1 family RND transporter [Gilliamella apicola]ORF48468.1 hydrophobe/amphiphile efflux-1 family RND transporter [Gilliamella apicola]ORF52497.1 hydrophobe/amphiphile efflux-1 family RND transporter [Gilliamella apicola]ORF54803.1 hydrophobe/amphiphile efflux-1 family RND transporter [Gilliamella apicola]